MKGRNALLSFDLEVTARCNNDCRHCYINLPAANVAARQKELTTAEVDRISSEAVELGATWCLITGGEPLLRQDFADLYLLLRRKGLLVSIFTNATLVTQEHVALLRKYPPRDVEVTVYGVTEATYELVTQRRGSFAAFRRGLDLLLDGGVKVRLKAMALRSNVHELPAIADFCRARTADYYHFDPLLHLRYDGDERRNRDIRAERLMPEEIVAIEQADDERAGALRRGCDELILAELSNQHCAHLFHCRAGDGSFTVGYDGLFRLCSDLHYPDCTYDLRHGTLAKARSVVVPRVRAMESDNPEFLRKCARCAVVNLCLWCPARAHLEAGRLDAWSDYFCSLAHARADAIQRSLGRAQNQG
jgi:radical SAM protein with 4Fe4S-binding SPASM domain